MMRPSAVNRRTFLALSGTAALAAPLPALAQQAQMKRLGFLINLLENDGQTTDRVAAFWAGAGKYGWSDKNLLVNYRFGASTNDAAAKLAEELMALRPDILFGATLTSLSALAALTKTVPIVFAYVSGITVDPLVDNYAHPGGNITGFVNTSDADLYGKRIDLLRELVPGLDKIALIYNPDGVPGGDEVYLKAWAGVAVKQDLQIVPYRVGTTTQIAAAVRGVAERVATDTGLGLIIPGDSYVTANRILTIAEVARHRLIAVWGQQSAVLDGGLVSHAPDPIPIFRGAGEYVGLVLNGARAGDLPIQASPPMLTVNLRTAKEFGITIPLSVIARADQVIE